MSQPTLISVVQYSNELDAVSTMRILEESTHHENPSVISRTLNRVPIIPLIQRWLWVADAHYLVSRVEVLIVHFHFGSFPIQANTAWSVLYPAKEKKTHRNAKVALESVAKKSQIMTSSMSITTWDF